METVHLTERRLSNIRPIVPAPEAVIQSEERYRAFVSNSSEGIWRFELEKPVSIDLPEDEQITQYFKYGYLAECNDAMAHMYGLREAKDLVGARLGTMLIESNPENLSSLRRFIREGHKLVDAESTEIDSHGSVKYFLNNFIGVVENGALMRAWGTQRDITERKRAMDQLKRIYRLNDAVSRAKKVEEIYDEALHGLIESVHADKSSILLFDAAGVMRFKGSVNLSDEYKKAVEGHSPWKKGAKNPQPFTISDSEKDSALVSLQETLRKEGIRSLAFIPLVWQEELIGKFMVYFERPHNYSPSDMQIIQTIANHVAFAIARKRDEENLTRTVNLLTEQAEQLWRSNQELEQFAYVSSHDLKEPLRAIASYAQLLDMKNQGKLDGESKSYIESVVNGVLRMQRLINDLLAFSRVGRIQLELTTVNMEDVLDLVLRDLKVGIEESHAFITHDPLPEVKADRSQMHQLLLNLVGNAVKFHGDKPPKIHISVEMDKNEKIFCVKDNGIGFDQKYGDQIFSVFQRLHSKRQYPGTGIGLAICKRIAERHGGGIWTVSKPGAGAAFYFSLP